MTALSHPPLRRSRVYKVIWLVKFRTDKSREEVVRWWREEHGPLAAATPGMARYVWRRTQDDGPTGFDSSTLVGGALDEHVVL
jgi:hypothetical protein